MTVKSAKVEALNDGDVFSLDGGSTWYTCAVVLFGTVSVYTDGCRTDDAELVRIEAERDQECMVQVVDTDVTTEVMTRKVFCANESHVHNLIWRELHRSTGPQARAEILADAADIVDRMSGHLSALGDAIGAEVEAKSARLLRLVAMTEQPVPLPTGDELEKDSIVADLLRCIACADKPVDRAYLLLHLRSTVVEHYGDDAADVLPALAYGYFRLGGMSRRKAEKIVWDVPAWNTAVRALGWVLNLVMGVAAGLLIARQMMGVDYRWMPGPLWLLVIVVAAYAAELACFALTERRPSRTRVITRT